MKPNPSRRVTTPIRSRARRSVALEKPLRRAVSSIRLFASAAAGGRTGQKTLPLI